jgi:hypothetical protein
MNQIYVNLLYTVISAGIPCLIGALFAAVKHFIGAQKMAKLISTLQTKSHLANEAVLFAEDAFKELGGPQKLESAKANLIGRLNSCGVPITLDEADTLIRSAYMTAKGSFDAEVAKAANT